MKITLLKLPIRDGGTFDNWFGGHKGVGPPEEHITNNLTLSGLDLAKAAAIEHP